MPRMDSVVEPSVLEGRVIEAISAWENETCMGPRQRTPLAQRKRGSAQKLGAPGGPMSYLLGVMPGTVMLGESLAAGAAGAAAVGVTAGASLFSSADTSSVMSRLGSA